MNAYQSQDQDDFSYYNQRSAIESRVTEIMREYREKFFEVSDPLGKKPFVFRNSAAGACARAKKTTATKETYFVEKRCICRKRCFKKHLPTIWSHTNEIVCIFILLTRFSQGFHVLAIPG